MKKIIVILLAALALLIISCAAQPTTPAPKPLFSEVMELTQTWGAMLPEPTETESPFVTVNCPNYFSFIDPNENLLGDYGWSFSSESVEDSTQINTNLTLHPLEKVNNQWLGYCNVNQATVDVPIEGASNITAYRLLDNIPFEINQIVPKPVETLAPLPTETPEP